MTEAKPSILIAILCGPERDKWINPFLATAMLSWTNDERFDQEYILAYDWKTSQEARNWACGQFLAGSHDWFLMIDNDVKPFHRGQIVNLLDLAVYNRGIVAAPVPVLQEGSLYLNCYVRQENGLYRSTMSEEFQARLDAGDKLLERDAVGTGAIMIRREVVQAMVASPLSDAERERWSKFLPGQARQPLIEAVFLRPRRRTGATELGEDLFFCERARARGFRCFVSLPHLCGHLHSVDLADVPEIKLAQGAAQGAASVSGLHPPDSRWDAWTAEDFGLSGPLPKLSVFSITPAIGGRLREILLEVLNRIPTNIFGQCLEIGAGVSTLVLAKVLADVARGGRIANTSLLSLESNEAHLVDVIKACCANHLHPYSVVLHAPIDAGWYEVPHGCIKPEHKFHFVFIDGPPGASRKMARLPALFQLKDNLAPGATIVLDDANREDEIECVRVWQRDFPGLQASFERVGDRSLAVMRWPG